MNRIKKFIIPLLIFIFSSLASYAQNDCIVALLANDLSSSTAEFKTTVKQSEGFMAWQLLNKEKPTLRTNIEELNLVSKNLEAIKSVGGYMKWKALQGSGNWATAIGKNIDELVEAPLGYQIFTKNGSNYIRRRDATDINTPRLMVDEAGSIVKYAKPQRLANSTKLRSNLEKVLGKAPDNHQAHHLVPSNVVEKSALHKEAINRGLYDVDRAGNGKFLAETDEDFVALSEAFPTHFGSHPNYDIQITKQIDDVLRANNLTPSSNLSNLTNQQLTNIIDDIEDLSLNILENWKPSKLN